MKYHVTNFTNCGKCSQCGQCCSNFIPLTRDEKKRLRKLVKENDVEVQIKSCHGSFVMMCPFLIMNNVNKTTKCSIYKDRPLICRYFKCDIKHPKPIRVKMELTDMMHEIIDYDYQKEVGMTFDEVKMLHIKNSYEDLK